MEQNVKQQIVERIKQATNILVTVSNDPSVDQLAAAIGLTLLLNKMDKHATAVFSGQVPSTIEFLSPDSTLERNTDSLRDFIISLDKSKADKLRYKVEDQVVRIFITPYRTSLSEKDLIFSQGDFNVEVVIALGVSSQDHLDGAITSHGRILHDATVITFNTSDASGGELGQMNWNDAAASSLSEMIVSISESFGSGLIDNQMATAFLTGIVAQTERFRNDKTSPKVMTMSAQLMAAGANQQLIASKLEEAKPVPPAVVPSSVENAPAAPPNEEKPEDKKPPASKDGLLTIAHQNQPEPVVELNPHEINIDDHGQLKTAEDIKNDQEEQNHPSVEPTTEDAQKTDSAERKSLDPNGSPSRDGTLTANTKQEPYSPSTDALSNPVTENAKLFNRDTRAVVSPLGAPLGPPHKPLSLDDLEASDKTLAEIEDKPKEPPVTDQPASAPPPPPLVDSARDAVNQAMTDSPNDPARLNPIQSLNANPLGSIEHSEPSAPVSLPPAQAAMYEPVDAPIVQPPAGDSSDSSDAPPSPPPPPGMPATPPSIPPPMPFSGQGPSPNNSDFTLPFPPA